MTDNKSLSLSSLAIGSLPHTDINDVMTLVKENFDIPFWPQLSKLNSHENMTVQFLENIPAYCYNKENDKNFLNSDSEEFYSELEQLFLDYEEILTNKNLKVLDKYAISSEYSSTFSYFIDIVKKTKPNFAKGQIIGPFTLSTTLTDSHNKCVYYDTTLREVVTKTLTLKALWQIYKIKEASPETKPIIFMDEPSLSQLNTSAYITISSEDVISQIKEISDIIKEHGGISAVHCCGRCDWENLTKANTDIINFDAYTHFDNFNLFIKSIKNYIKNGGLIAWGMVPTLNKSALEKETVESLKSNFDNIINSISDNDLNRQTLLEHSIITPSCGAASLTIELAKKAMELTKELTKKIKEG